MPQNTHTEFLRQAAPLTPAGLKSFMLDGRDALEASLLTYTKGMTDDDLARLTALALFVAEETKKGE